MRKIPSACVAGLLCLTACVSDNASMSMQPGRYSSYRDLLVEVGRQAKFPAGTPQDVKERYAQCAADLVIANTSPVDLEKLNAFARGQREMTVGESERMDADLYAKAGAPLTQGGLYRLKPYCPDDVADFEKYPPHQ